MAIWQDALNLLKSLRRKEALERSEEAVENDGHEEDVDTSNEGSDVSVVYGVVVRVNGDRIIG